jgi:hypothetical protein
MGTTNTMSIVLKTDEQEERRSTEQPAEGGTILVVNSAQITMHGSGS